MIVFIAGVHPGISAVDHSAFDKRYLLVLDEATLNCHLCLKSLDAFLDFVHANGKEHVTTGVLIYGETMRDANEKQKKIISTQLNGFRIGNNIKFPIIFDEKNIFRFKETHGLFLLVFDDKSRKIKTFIFPLKKEDYDEIF